MKIEKKLFQQYNQEAMEVLNNIEQQEAQFASLVETVAEVSDLKPAEVKAFFKARYNDKVEGVISKGDLFDSLNSLLDN